MTAHIDSIMRSGLSAEVHVGWCRALGISSTTFYKWRPRYGGMDVSLMARIKELEAEDARLRKMYVEEMPKAEIVTEALEKNGEAISPPRDGPTCRARPRRICPDGLRGFGWNHMR